MANLIIFILIAVLCYYYIKYKVYREECDFWKGMSDRHRKNSENAIITIKEKVQQNKMLRKKLKQCKKENSE